MVVLVTRHRTWSGENGTSSSERSLVTSSPEGDVVVSSVGMARHPPSGTWGFVDAQFLFEEYELCVGGIWVGYHGQLQATYSRRMWLLLWLLILIAGDNSRRTSQCPRNESMGLTGKTCGWGKSRITDERAIFHPMTR